MAQPTIHDPVQFFIGVIAKDESLMEKVKESFANKWDIVQPESARLDFDNFTEYYKPEMGTGLIRVWFPLEKKESEEDTPEEPFERLGQPEDLVRLKWICTAIEINLANEGTRRVNLDPGYLTEAKIILASFKDFAHRIYLTQGVFADMQLVFKGGKFIPREWTFSDYQTAEAQRFFLKLRELYRAKLKAYIESQLDAIRQGSDID